MSRFTPCSALHAVPHVQRGLVFNAKPLLFGVDLFAACMARTVARLEARNTATIGREGSLAKR